MATIPTRAPQTRYKPDAVSAAWGEFQSCFCSLIRQYGDQASKQFEHPLMLRADRADEAIAVAPAESLPTVAMKLRRIFAALVQEPWAERFALGEDTPEMRRALDIADMWQQALWGAIEDVERLVGREG